MVQSARVQEGNIDQEALVSRPSKATDGFQSFVAFAFCNVSSPMNVLPSVEGPEPGGRQGSHAAKCPLPAPSPGDPCDFVEGST